MGPGKGTHAPHAHENDEFFFILGGRAKFNLDEKETVDRTLYKSLLPLQYTARNKQCGRYRIEIPCHQENCGIK